ncbi:cation diffusion facilitator family transporter [Tepidibacillus sp. LV47]
MKGDFFVQHAHHVTDKKSTGINIAFWLTFLLFVAEIIGGILTNSLAILSDAWYLLSDILALGVSWFALRQARKPANKRLTFGYHRFGIFAAFFNNLTLIAISFYIFYTAVLRIFHPKEVKSLGMVYLAILGLVITGTIVLFLRKEEQNLNVRSAVLHFVGDVFSYAGVILGGMILHFTGWLWIDPIISIVFASIILRGAFSMLRESFWILLEGVPSNFDVDEITKDMESVPGVHSVHDVHIWGISAEEVMLTAHIVVEEQPVSEGHDLLHEVKKVLRGKYGIRHSILQLETIDYQEKNKGERKFDPNLSPDPKMGFDIVSLTRKNK